MSENRQKTERKAPKTAFKPGVSGNPGGRPKRTEEEIDLISACKAKAPEALAILESIMVGGENERNRITAALAIIERAHGKPLQQVDAKVEGSMTVNWPLPRGPLDG
jgi:hypothetical protein